jgi:hypothetical protein
MNDLYMRTECAPKGFKFIISYIVLLASLLNNPIDGRVMYVAYFWEKMVFHLKV